MIARALRAFTLLAAILLCVDQAARAAEGSSAFFPSPQPEKDRLSIHAATDLVAMEPLIRDFQSVFPNVAVDYVEYVTNDLQNSASEACRTGAVLGDILLSPSVDQLVKLANDGCAAPHVSAETAHVADWANWRDEVFGFTYEPAVFVYNARLVPSGDVPRTHIELADLLRRRIDFIVGGSERSTSGFRASATYWRSVMRGRRPRSTVGFWKA
ncbi:hypothetical protein NLY44_32725 [Mesorhizobium sp. C089B]|uniref:hypothetical protein n=1 Tax=Mesorhizobium sp. C089B TaxID=2956823 RepID=UPI0025774DE7|nr:hypothetical protein [Mesorhizobium sp. C089B]WJI51149.1 hypothetical protein NLY44_32725 [Mesorhizobium sp. C089B]